jgi:peptidyl-prolyl cis-trans isomerase C
MKPFEEALFALKTGEVSGVVETRLGYHLVKAVDRKPEMTIPFENLKDELRTLLKQEKGQQEANASIGKVREKARVEIFLPAEVDERSLP